MGYVLEFIKSISLRSQVVAHQLIWNMKTNMYIDEEMQHKDSMQIQITNIINLLAALYDTLDTLTNAIVDCLSGPAKKFYEREFDFFSKITDISGKIRPFPKGKFNY
jgi:phosphatidylinositol 4-kinase